MLLFSTVLLILFVGLRLEVGADWFVYLRTFRHMSSDLSTVIAQADPGYSLLNWAVKRLGLGIWAVNLVCATIFMLGLRAFCMRQAEPELALLVAFPYLVTVIAMGYSRQGVAIGLIMWAIAAALEGKLVRVLIAVFLAIAFHRSAVIAVPLIMLVVSDTRAKMAAVAILGVICYFIFVQSTVTTLYVQYVERQMSSSGAAIRLTMNLVPAVLFVALWRQMNFSPSENRLWMGFSIVAFATSFVLLISDASTAVDRIALYVMPIQLAILSRVTMFSEDKRLARLPIITYSMIVLVAWFSFGSFSWAWTPYRNYLFVPENFRPTFHRY